jgi:hypothetical protein
MGAINFLVKPIRLNECRALASKMKQTKITAGATVEGIQKYEVIRPLGQGAAG